MPASNVTTNTPSNAGQPVNKIRTTTRIATGDATNQTTLDATFTWSIHYTDETGNQLRPDSVITHDYTRTDTGDQMGNWFYVPNSVKVTGTPNAGWHIDNPDFKFNQAAGGTTFDYASWNASAASIDGYIPKYGSVVITDQLPKNPESLHATTTVDSGKHEFTFVYTQRPKTVTINYVNDDDNEKVVSTGTVSGKPNTSVTITPSLPSGYMLTPGKDVPSKYTMTDGDNQAVTIHVQKQFIDVSDTDPQAEQTRTITLHYVYSGGSKDGQKAFDDSVLDVYYHRTATFDRVTNQTTYGDWTWDKSQGDSRTPGYHVVSGKWTSLPQSWANVTADVPSIKGYYADLGQNDPANINHVPANTWVFPTYNNAGGGGHTVDGHSATAYLDGYGYEVSPTHTIKYVPNKTTVTVNYVDDDNNKAIVGSQHWDGTIGQHIDLTLTPPANYVLTPGWVNPSSYDFDGVNSSWFTVHVKHATQDVTDQEPKDQITKVTRLTRNHLYGDGPHKGEKFDEPDIFDLALKRTATKDLVTNKITFGDWQVDRDNSKNVQGSLWIYPDNSVGGSLRAGRNGYSYLGRNTHQELVLTDDSTMQNTNYNYGWNSDQALKYPILNIYYGPEQVKIPIYYIDADTGQQVANKVNDEALTGDDFRDGNTVTIDQSKLTSLPTTLTGYQLLPGQTLPTSYKIDTFAGVKAINVQVVKDRSVKVTFVDDDNKGAVVGTPTIITGHTGGDPVALDLTVPDKYELADGQQLPTSYTFTKGSGDLIIHLVHQERSVTVRFIDDRFVQFTDGHYLARQVGQAITLTGRAGDTVDLNLTVPDKYQLADGQQLPTSYTFTKGSGDVTIHLVHKIVQREAIIDVRLGLLTEVHIDNNSDDIDVIPKTKWTPQLADEFKTADTDDLAYKLRLSSSVEAGTLTGHVNYDLVDEKVVSFGDDWTTLNLNGQTYQMPNGTDVVNGVILEYNNRTSENFREGILKSYPILDPDYANRAWHGYLSVNATNNNDLIDGVHQLGLQAGLAGDEPNALAKATGDRAAISVEMGNKTIDLSLLQSIINLETVDFSEQNGQLRADEFLPVGGVYIPYVEKTATRTINVTMPDGKTTTVKQTATLAKQVVLENDAHQNWTAGEWARYDVPTIPGYTASQPNVAQQTVTGETEDQTVNITYTANPQTTTVVYQTEDGTLVHTTTVDGKTGQTVKVPNEVPTGWQVVDGKVPSEITFVPNGVPKTVVTIDHNHVTVTPATPKTTGDKLPDNPDKNYPAGVSETDLNKTITRTIKVTTPDGKTKTIEQTAKLTRTADVDEVTGEVKYSDWTAGNWSSYTAPSVPGYTASQSNVAQQTVTSETEDQTVNITYTANPQTTHVDYVDGNGKVVHTTTVNGQTNQTVDVPSEVPAGWFISYGEVPSEITFGANGHKPVLVKISHSVLTVMPNTPKTIDDLLPDNPTVHYPSGVSENDLNKTVTRTIKVTQPDGTTTNKVQPVKFSRGAKVDEVTGKIVVYGDWETDSGSSTGQWDAYEVPTVAGYTATQANVAATLVDEHTTDQTVNVSYTPNKQTTTVKYIDDQGEVVHTTTVDGLTNQTVKVSSEIPDGWKLVDGQTVPNTITFGPDGHEDMSVKIEHQHVTVTLDHPQNSGTKLPDNPAKTFEGVEANDLNKTITRTIKVTTPDGKSATTKQTAKLTRTADVDEVTGEVTYGNWTTGEWAVYNAPSVAGYTPSQSTVSKESVTADSKDATVEITYMSVQHQISVEYVDDDDYGKIVKTDQMPGKTDQTITVTPSAPSNYDLVDNGNRTYTVTSDDAQAVQIHVKHHQVITSESKTVTRTIDVHTPHDGNKTIKQTAELTRKVTTDQVTGEKTYGDWTTGQWKAYIPEAIPGYTPSTNEVPNVSIDGNSKNQTVDVNYTADAQKVEIAYVDDTKGDAVVKTDRIVGKTDETVKLTPDVPAGYELVGKVPGDYTMTADGHQVIIVHLVHQMKTASESKTVARTINVHTPHDGTKVVKQTAKLTRDVTTDQVTGEKTYGDWSATEWDRYAVPAVAGYVPSVAQVAQQVVNGTTTDQTVDVTYTSGEHTTRINYVDQDGNIVHTTTIKGQTDGTSQVPNETPAGWTVVGKPVPTELAFGPDGHVDVIVTVDHQHVTVTPDNPKAPTDKLPDNPAKTYPNGVGHDDLNKTVTRTVKVTTPDGQTKTVTQTAKLTRTADVDEVTGKVTYGKWTTGEWSSYEVPVVPGYTASQNEVPAVKVTDDTKDQTVTVTYTANAQTTHINYVDGNGKIVHTTIVTGKTDQTVKVPNEVPTGWTITDGQVPSEVTFGANGHDDVTVMIDHHHVTVTSDKPQTDGTQLPDNPSKTFHGVSETDLNKVVTRTIEIASPARKTTTVKQTANLTRTADVDEVTGEVTYGKWTTGAWSSYTVPTVAGYTPSQAVVGEVAVDANTADQTVKIVYTADSHTTHINYADKDGNVVHTTTVTGVTDQTVKVPNETPSGWKVTGEPVPAELSFGSDGHADVTVTVTHQHVTVTPDQPKTSTDKLPDNSAKTYPNGVGHDDLHKTITRTIKITMPDGQTKTVAQTAKLTRTANVDEVTGAVTYGNWTTGDWLSYDVPTVPGYTSSQSEVSTSKVTDDTKDQTVTVTYTANDQTTHINYVDINGKIVHTTTITGKTNQTVKVPNEVPAGWVITGGQVPSEVTFGANGHDDVTVTVDHQHVTVTPDQPQPDGTPLPDNPSQHFTGVESGDLNKTITRTIVFKVPGRDPQTITQTAKLTRTATVDEVTGEVIYGDWIIAQWPSLTVPVVDGYTASQTQIPAVTVEQTTDNQTVTVDYQAVEVPTTSTTMLEARPTAASYTSSAKPMTMPTTHAKVASPSASTTPVAPVAKTSQMPQTGVNKVSSTIMTSLGLLMGALSAYVFGRKQKGKGRKS